MPRAGRIVIANFPHHVIHRGHNRETVFARDQDFQCYLENLAEFKNLFDVRVYGWCLMSNHVHLVLAPGNDTAALGRLMKRLAGRQTRYVNQRAGRSGSLWEGRYKSSPIDADAYLLCCVRYVELNPVRAGVVDRAEDYPWSSYAQRMGVRAGHPWLDLDPCYQALAKTGPARRRRYQAFLQAGTSPQERDFIHAAVQRGQLTGDAQFVDKVQRTFGYRVEFRKQGRPRKAE